MDGIEDGLKEELTDELDAGEPDSQKGDEEGALEDLGLMSIQGLDIVMLDTSSSDPFAGGDGTNENPYVIKTADQLNEVRNHLDKCFILADSIDLSDYKLGEGWHPIGTETEPFTGSLDGNDYSITNSINNGA